MGSKANVAHLTPSDYVELHQLLFHLIKIESHELYSNYELDVAHYIKEWFQTNDIECELQEVLPNRYNVIANIRAEGDKLSETSLLFNGHLDTVPPYGMENAFNPYINDGKVFGRGTVDMKGALAAMMLTLKKINTIKHELKSNLYFVATVGEETYSPGAFHFKNQNIQTTYCVVGEPTELKVGTAHKGVAWLRAIFKGRAAHGSVPELGENAISFATKWINYIDEAYIPTLKEKNHPLLGNATMNIGMIHGGTRPVIVPHECEVYFERRFLPTETAHSCLQEYEQTIKALQQLEPNLNMSIALMDNFKEVPHEAFENKVDSKLSLTLRELYANHYNTTIPEEAGLQFWTDAALLKDICDEVVVCGPGHIGQAHSNQEYVTIEQLNSALTIYFKLAQTLCVEA